jgi:hypothetical protein
MDVYNILTIELNAEDLRSSATNGGKVIPLAPNTRSVNIKGIVQTSAPAEKGTTSDDRVPALGGLPMVG